MQYIWYSWGLSDLFHLTLFASLIPAHCAVGVTAGDEYTARLQLKSRGVEFNPIFIQNLVIVTFKQKQLTMARINGNAYSCIGINIIHKAKCTMTSRLLPRIITLLFNLICFSAVMSIFPSDFQIVSRQSSLWPTVPQSPHCNVNTQFCNSVEA